MAFSLASKHHRLGCQCSVPDHVDRVSPETAQTLQTAHQAHCGILDKLPRRSRNEVRLGFSLSICTTEGGGPEGGGGAISHFALFCFAPFLSPLLVFLKDQASSHLLETILQLSPKSLLRELYKQHLKGHLVGLALHPIANFPVQRLTAASAKCKMVGFK